jgi:integrase
MLVRYLTDEQEAILLDHVPPHYHGIVLTALNTGLRQGELLRLTWADIDWNVGVLTVNETKAGERRRVPMNSTVVSVLTELKTSGPTGEEPIFTHTARYRWTQAVSIPRPQTHPCFALSHAKSKRPNAHGIGRVEVTSDAESVCTPVSHAFVSSSRGSHSDWNHNQPKQP